MRKLVLTVDDSRVMRRLITGTIEMLGYEPIEAGDGAQAMAVLERRGDEIALVLLDWNMPVMNGFDTLLAIQADPRFRDIPVMMVTTESETQNVVRALQAGAKHYLSKPFSPQDLQTRVMEALGCGF